MLMSGTLPLFAAAIAVTRLVRPGPSVAVTTAGALRARALSGAIQLNPRPARRLQGARVLLVDDVLTSGATSNACISVLKRAGAQTVVVACFARVLDEALDLT